MKAFGKDISLSLKPTEGLLRGNHLPMWTVTKNASQPDGLRYEKVTNVSFPYTSWKFIFNFIFFSPLSLSKRKKLIFYSIFPHIFCLRVFKNEKHESENQINAKLCRIALKFSSSISKYILILSFSIYPRPRPQYKFPFLSSCHSTFNETR